MGERFLSRAVEGGSEISQGGGDQGWSRGERKRRGRKEGGERKGHGSLHAEKEKKKKGRIGFSAVLFLKAKTTSFHLKVLFSLKMHFVKSITNSF